MPHSDPSFAEKPPENHPFCAHFRALDFGQIALGQLVATVNRPVIDRGLFPSTKTHGQEGADRGYPLTRNCQFAGGADMRLSASRR